jgi:hypothetical protein
MVALRAADDAKIADTSDGLVLVAPHPSPAPRHYLALDGAGHADRDGRDSMIRRSVI